MTKIAVTLIPDPTAIDARLVMAHPWRESIGLAVTAMPRILTRWRFLLLLICCTLLVWMNWALVPTREPRYHGHSLSQWAACVNADHFADSDRFPARDDEVREVLVLLGTNNLSLLVRWIDSEHTLKRRAVRALFQVSPHWLLQTGIFDFLVTERWDLALSQRAMEVFRVLGPRAAPAIPKLVQLVMKRDPPSGRGALRVLRLIGEPATPAILSLAGCSNTPCRIAALSLLWAHTNAPAARIVLTSAKRDPDIEVRRAAIHALNGEEDSF
jgi:hypothetical protein